MMPSIVVKAKLVADVKKEIPSTDISVNPQTVKITIAGDYDGHTRSKD